jgi:hypothetical protein
MTFELWLVSFSHANGRKRSERARLSVEWPFSPMLRARSSNGSAFTGQA